MCDEVEPVNGFCYLGDMLNASGGCKAAVTARTKLEQKFRECGEILFGRRFSLGLKKKVYKSYVRSAMLYGNKTWCLRENELVEKSRKIYGEGNVQCKVGGQKE